MMLINLISIRKMFNQIISLSMIKLINSISYCDAGNNHGQHLSNGVGGNSADGNQSDNGDSDDNQLDATNDQLVQLHANQNGEDGDQPENDNVDGPEPEIHNANDNLSDNDEELDEEFWNNLPKIVDLPKLNGVEFVGNHIKYTKQTKNGKDGQDSATIQL
ncbi:hypothetical protein niasHT_001501 [Heterodera trifolii]|uniref:Effector protein n=1 Tax=Heterodera trifolii TaxID=157864 RepID=A0ABD2MFB9_9BILA